MYIHAESYISFPRLFRLLERLVGAFIIRAAYKTCPGLIQPPSPAHDLKIPAGLIFKHRKGVIQKGRGVVAGDDDAGNRGLPVATERPRFSFFKKRFGDFYHGNTALAREGGVKRDLVALS